MCAYVNADTRKRTRDKGSRKYDSNLIVTQWRLPPFSNSRAHVYTLFPHHYIDIWLYIAGTIKMCIRRHHSCWFCANCYKEYVIRICSEKVLFESKKIHHWTKAIKVLQDDFVGEVKLSSIRECYNRFVFRAQYFRVRNILNRQRIMPDWNRESVNSPQSHARS